MSEERVPYGNTDGNSILLPLNEMGECVVSAAGWQSMFTTCTGAVGKLAIGENITTVWNVCAGNVTHTGMSGD